MFSVVSKYQIAFPAVSGMHCKLVFLKEKQTKGLIHPASKTASS